MADNKDDPAALAALPLERFSVDESGYTGADLLNDAQRFQGASAICISDDEAQRLIKEHFPKLQATELKYSSVGKRASYREPILNLVRDALKNHKAITYICDKRFLLVLQFLDYATEPYYHQRGVDFYEDGQNYAMASMFYRTGPTFLGADVFFQIMAAFQRAMKEKTKETLEDLVLKVRRSKWETTLPEVLGPIAEATPECVSAITTPGVSTDAALVVLQSLITRIEVMADGPYRIEHDRSDNLLQYSAILQNFIDHEEEAEFKGTEITTLKFPLKLAQVTQVDSVASPAVQVADVLIGSAIGAGNIMAGLRSGEIDPEKLMGLYRHDQFIHLLPSLDFEEQKKFRKGSQGSKAIDYLGKIMSK